MCELQFSEFENTHGTEGFDASPRKVRLRTKLRIQAMDEPREEASVQRLRHGVPCRTRVSQRVLPLDRFPTRHETGGAERFHKICGVQTEQISDCEQRAGWRSSKLSVMSLEIDCRRSHIDSSFRCLERLISTCITGRYNSFYQYH